MYSTKEKLHHFIQLTNPQAVEADLALLHEKKYHTADFVNFDLAPLKHSDDILFALLNVASHEEIVRYRRKFFADKKIEDATSDENTNSTVESPEESTEWGQPKDTTTVSNEKKRLSQKKKSSPK